MEDQVIVYNQENGVVAVVVPAPDCGLTLEQIFEKDVPDHAKATAEIVDRSHFPSDRVFRNAWTHKRAKERAKHEKAVDVDMPKAKDVYREMLRRARKSKLEELDVAYLRASEDGDQVAMEDVMKRKRFLRDLPQDPAIDAAKTPDELLGLWPADLERV